MKKICITLAVLVGFLPAVTLLEVGANSLYAISLRSQLKDVLHPVSSVMLRKDWSVANCGNASNQCCFAYVEVREIKELEEKNLGAWYAGIVGTPDLLRHKEYVLFRGDNEGEASTLRALFGSGYGELSRKTQKGNVRYVFGFVESGYPTGLDYRCH